MKKLAAYGLILIGILMICYPKTSEWYDARQEEKLLAAWEESLMNEEAEQEALNQYDGLTSLFAEETESNTEETAEPDAEPSTEPSTEPTASPSPAKAPAKLNAIATIKIPSIDLKLPVLEGATEKNMKVAAVHLKETTKLGEVGNAAIAAHRMRIKGRLFNRLDEVRVGDKITVETKDDTFVYKVYKISIVEPTDVSVLNYNNTDRRLTLITCDPLINPTHRLIVHAEME
jgi:sortase A